MTGRNEQETYHESRDKNHAIWQAQQTALDKYILTLSSSTLGLSLTIIYSYSNGKKLVCMPFAQISWIFLFISIASILFSFFSSAQSCKSIINQMDDYFKEHGKVKQNLKSCWDLATDFLNVSSVLSFVIGLLFFIFFVWKNV